MGDGGGGGGRGLGAAKVLRVLVLGLELSTGGSWHQWQSRRGHTEHAQSNEAYTRPHP